MKRKRKVVEYEPKKQAKKGLYKIYKITTIYENKKPIHIKRQLKFRDVHKRYLEDILLKLERGLIG